MFTILPHICFLVFIFLLHLYINWTGWLNCNKVQFHCNSHFLMWSLLLMLHPLVGPFIFRDLGYLYQLVVHGPSSLSRAHIALQELQAVEVMLCRMAFCLSGKVVALHLDNSTAKAYLHNQGGTVSPFLSRLACRILSLTNKHGITLLPAYIPTHLNVEADFLSLGSAASGVAPSTLSGSGCFLPLGPSRGGPPGIFSFCSMPALFHIGNSTASGGLGVECLQPSLEISGKFMCFLLKLWSLLFCLSF